MEWCYIRLEIESFFPKLQETVTIFEYYINNQSKKEIFYKLFNSEKKIFDMFMYIIFILSIYVYLEVYPYEYTIFIKFIILINKKYLKITLIVFLN